MNKYEALGRLTEAETELQKARISRQLVAEQLYDKSKDVLVRYKDTPEQAHFNKVIAEMEVLLNNFKTEHQHVCEWLDEIEKLKTFC